MLANDAFVRCAPSQRKHSTYMPESSAIRKNRKQIKQIGVSGNSSPFALEKWAPIVTVIAAVISTLAATATLYVSENQFRENLRVQENALFLQNKAFQTERASKAAEIFEKYLEVRSKTTTLPPGQKRDEFYFNRNNRGLLLLDALYSSTRGDDQWEGLVSYSLIRYEEFARNGRVLCLTLTDDFLKLMDKHFPEAAEKKCNDLTTSE